MKVHTKGQETPSSVCTMHMVILQIVTKLGHKVLGSREQLVSIFCDPPMRIFNFLREHMFLTDTLRYQQVLWFLMNRMSVLTEKALQMFLNDPRKSGITKCWIQPERLCNCGDAQEAEVIWVLQPEVQSWADKSSSNRQP